MKPVVIKKQKAVLLVATAVFLMVGCGGDGAGFNRDAGTDASTLEDASRDASLLPDGDTVQDDDNDGYPVDHDCDDHDNTIYPGIVRDCESQCDVGTETCLADGTWSNCTAQTDCECTTPGETRLVDCGNCGQASQECGLDLVWGTPGECLQQGECSPGNQETQACEYCGGNGTRLCNQQCIWGPWQGCTGVCTPNAIERTNNGCTFEYEIQERECSAQCQWTTTTACTSNCFIQARTGTADFKDEVCVSGGPFIMGSQPGAWGSEEEPQHGVNLTPYLIDIYEVTNDRYRECVTAGSCTEPPFWSYYHISSHGNSAVEGVTYDQAQTFCQWDGGRTLPTEAQWEKAARGPSPRTVTDPWGSDSPTCSLVTISDCLGNLGPYDVNLAPDGNSFYGLYNQASNAREWVADWFDANYYSNSPSLDPTGPITGQDRVVRGAGYNLQLSSYHDTVTIRYWHLPTDTEDDLGFRCARPGY